MARFLGTFGSMKTTLIVYTHPNPQSFNFAITKTVEETLVQKGHQVKVRDLYAEPFKAVLDAADFESFAKGIIPDDIKREQELLTWAEHLVFIYPIWWYDRPALLKGWIDRVFSHGFAYQYGPSGVKGLLKQKKALVIQTAGNTEAELQEDNIIEIVQRPMTEGTLEFCGIPDVQVRTFAAISKTDLSRNAAMLLEVREQLLKDW